MINWGENCSSNYVEQMFVDEFVRLGLIQCIKSTTHIGNTLDILLANSENHVSDICILSNNEVCKSDHFAIIFEVKLKLQRKKALKINTLNYKRANWDLLYRDLNSVDCLPILDSQESDIIWANFKQVLNHFLQIHIPKITIQSRSHPPWFDSECYIKCREKERLHKKIQED